MFLLHADTFYLICILYMTSWGGGLMFGEAAGFAVTLFVYQISVLLDRVGIKIDL